MRPVIRPLLSGHYDTVAMEAKLISVSEGVPSAGGKKRKLDKTQRAASAVASDLADLIDKWGNNHFEMISYPGDKRVYYHISDPQDDNLKDNAKYSTYLSSVASDHDYGQARFDLIDGIGAYCSYCELPMPAALAVEHSLPKVYFPKSFLKWDNFLLACPICNSTKNDKPNQDIDKLYNGTDQAVTYMRSHYAWPNSYASDYAPNDPLPFQYKLHSVTPVKTKWTLGAEITDAHVIADLAAKVAQGLSCIQHNMFCILDYPDGTGPADDPNKAAFRNNATYYAVVVTARENVTHPDLATAMEKMINVTKLNAMADPSNLALTDYRLPLRTQAYFRALKLRKLYDDMTTSGLSPTVNFTPLLQNAMSASGFWGVWLTVFKDVLNIQTTLSTGFKGTNTMTWTV